MFPRPTTFWLVPGQHGFKDFHEWRVLFARPPIPTRIDVRILRMMLQGGGWHREIQRRGKLIGPGVVLEFEQEMGQFVTNRVFTTKG